MKRVQEEQQEAKAEKASAPRTCAAALEAAKDNGSASVGERRALGENNNLARRPTSAAGQAGNIQNASKPLDPPKLIQPREGIQTVCRRSSEVLKPVFGAT